MLYPVNDTREYSSKVEKESSPSIKKLFHNCLLLELCDDINSIVMDTVNKIKAATRLGSEVFSTVLLKVSFV